MKKIFFVLLCSIILTSCIGTTPQDNIESTVVATGSNENLEVEGLQGSVNDSSIVDEASESENVLDDELKIDDIEEQVSSKDVDMEIEVIDTDDGVVEKKEGENVVSEKKAIEPDLTYWLKQYYPDTDVRKSRILYEEDKYVYGDYLYWNDYLEDYSIKYFFGVKKKTRYLIFKDIDPLYHAYCSTFESLPVNFIPDCVDNNSNIVFTKNPSVFYKGMTVEDRKIVHDMMGISDSGEEYEGKTYCLISDISYNYIDAGCHAVGGIGGFRLVYGKKDGRWGEAFSGHDINEVSGLEFKVVVNDDGSYEKVFSFTKFQSISENNVDINDSQDEINILKGKDENTDITDLLKNIYPHRDIIKSRILYEEDQYVYGDYLIYVDDSYDDYYNGYDILYFFGMKTGDTYSILDDLSIRSTYCSEFTPLPVSLVPDCFDNNYDVVFTKNSSLFYNGMSLEDRKIVHEKLGREKGTNGTSKEIYAMYDIGENYIGSNLSMAGSSGGIGAILGKKNGEWIGVYTGFEPEYESGWKFKIIIDEEGGYKKIFSFTDS